MTDFDRYPDFSSLLGKTITVIGPVKPGDDTIHFETEDGCAYRLYHSQDCCENVTVEEVIGDVADLIVLPLAMAEEVTQDAPEQGDSGTWTFYKLATARGYVTIRWLGTSNGYYSEGVTFERTR